MGSFLVALFRNSRDSDLTRNKKVMGTGFIGCSALYWIAVAIYNAICQSLKGFVICVKVASRILVMYNL
jgi:hypothetical protein